MDPNILALIRPFNVFSPKIRCGRNEDGGYIINQLILDNTNLLYSFGVGGEFSFEEDIVLKNPKIQCKLFDHTVDIPENRINSPNIKFYKRGLSNEKENNCNSIPAYLELFNDSPDNLLLKLDVEGYEYLGLLSTDYDIISKFSGIICEFHSLNNQEYRSVFAFVVSRLLKLFTIFHIHANNIGGCFRYKDVHFPSTLEISFINNNLITKKEFDKVKYPIAGLDFPNGGSMDFPLNFWDETIKVIQI